MFRENGLTPVRNREDILMPVGEHTNKFYVVKMNFMQNLTENLRGILFTSFLQTKEGGKELFSIYKDIFEVFGLDVTSATFENDLKEMKPERLTYGEDLTVNVVPVNIEHGVVAIYYRLDDRDYELNFIMLGHSQLPFVHSSMLFDWSQHGSENFRRNSFLVVSHIDRTQPPREREHRVAYELNRIDPTGNSRRDDHIGPINPEDPVAKYVTQWLA